VFFYNYLKIQVNLKIGCFILILKLPIFLTVAYFYEQSFKKEISDFRMRNAEFNEVLMNHVERRVGTSFLRVRAFLTAKP